MIIFFFVFSNTQIAFAFLLSTLFQNPRTVVTFGFIYVFALSFMSSFLIGNLVDSNSPAVIYLELLPAFALFRGLYEFSNYAFMGNYQGTAGMTFSRFGDEGNGMVEIIVILLIEFPIFMCLAWYLEQVLGQIGTRKHWLFCFGGQRLTSKAAVTSAESLLSNDAPKDRRISMDSEDVREERVRVENMASYKGQAIVLRSLKKVYPPQGGKPAKVRTMRRPRDH